MPKIRLKSVFLCRPPKTDFKFLIHTPKTCISKIKDTFFIAYLLDKFQIPFLKRILTIINSNIYQSLQNLALMQENYTVRILQKVYFGVHFINKVIATEVLILN